MKYSICYIIITSVLLFHEILLCNYNFSRGRLDFSFANLIAPVVTTTSIILSSTRIQSGDILVLAYPGCPGKWPLNKCCRHEEAKYADITDYGWDCCFTSEAQCQFRINLDWKISRNSGDVREVILCFRGIQWSLLCYPSASLPAYIIQFFSPNFSVLGLFYSNRVRSWKIWGKLLIRELYFNRWTTCCKLYRPCRLFPATSAAVCSLISDDRGDTGLSPGLQ